MRAARGGSGGAAFRPGRVAPLRVNPFSHFGFHCLTPLFALRAAAPAGRPFGRVALLPSGCLPHAAIRAARGGSGGAAVRPGRVAPFGLFASRRYSRCARWLRRGGLSAGSRCSLRVVCLTPLCALRAAAPAGRPFGRVALLPFESIRFAATCLKARRTKCASLWVFCLTPLFALRAAAPAGRPFGRVALLPYESIRFAATCLKPVQERSFPAGADVIRRGAPRRRRRPCAAWLHQSCRCRSGRWRRPARRWRGPR